MKTLKLESYQLRNIIQEEKELFERNLRFEKMLLRESARLEKEGYTRNEINQHLFEFSFGSLGGGFVKSIKNKLFNSLLGFLNIGTDGIIAKAMSNVIQNIDLFDFKKYFSGDGTRELASLFVKSTVETGGEKIANSVVQTLGIDPESPLYDVARESLGEALAGSEFAEGMTNSLVEFFDDFSLTDLMSGKDKEKEEDEGEGEGEGEEGETENEQRLQL